MIQLVILHSKSTTSCDTNLTSDTQIYLQGYGKIIEILAQESDKYYRNK